MSKLTCDDIVKESAGVASALWLYIGSEGADDVSGTETGFRWILLAALRTLRHWSYRAPTAAGLLPSHTPINDTPPQSPQSVCHLHRTDSVDDLDEASSPHVALRLSGDNAIIIKRKLSRSVLAPINVAPPSHHVHTAHGVSDSHTRCLWCRFHHVRIAVSVILLALWIVASPLILATTSRVPPTFACSLLCAPIIVCTFITVLHFVTHSLEQPTADMTTIITQYTACVLRILIRTVTTSSPALSSAPPSPTSKHVRIRLRSPSFIAVDRSVAKALISCQISTRTIIVTLSVCMTLAVAVAIYLFSAVHFAPPPAITTIHTAQMTAAAHSTTPRHFIIHDHSSNDYSQLPCVRPAVSECTHPWTLQPLQSRIKLFESELPPPLTVTTARMIASIAAVSATMADPPRIRIIVESHSRGILVDAQLYHSVLPNSYVVAVDEGDVMSHPDIDTYADINLHIETVLAPPPAFPSRYHWMMVAQEFFRPDWKTLYSALPIHAFLCKTRYAQTLVNSWLRTSHAQTLVVYTRHSSIDSHTLSSSLTVTSQLELSRRLLRVCHTETPLPSPVSLDSARLWSVFVHLAGKSKMKQTEQVIKAWINAGGFLTAANTDSSMPMLIVTCRDRCMTERIKRIIIDDFVKVRIPSNHVSVDAMMATDDSTTRCKSSLVAKEYPPLSQLDSFALFQPELKLPISDNEADYYYAHRSFPNIRIYSTLPASSPLWSTVVARAGAYVCPSSTEGYGHYLNEGRSAGGIIITTDAAPMNELVSDRGNGLLIKVSQTVPSYVATGYHPLPRSFVQEKNVPNAAAFFVEPNGIASAIQTYLNLNTTTKVTMSERSRMRYENDTIDFTRTMEALHLHFQQRMISETHNAQINTQTHTPIVVSPRIVQHKSQSVRQIVES